MSDKANFTCKTTGENSEAKSDSTAGMNTRQDMTINGQLDLSEVIKFNDGGKVYHITLESSPGAYDYVLNVDAKGPSGVFSGGGHLEFYDANDDKPYSLYIYSSTRSQHTLRYNSSNPAIVKIKWSS